MHCGTGGGLGGEEKKQAVGKNKPGPRHEGCMSIVHGIGLIRMAEGEQTSLHLGVPCDCSSIVSNSILLVF